MPRTARASVGGICYHVMNRGNRRERVFHSSADYLAFIDFMRRAQQRLPLHLLCYCIMPNHFHLLVRPHGDGDLGRWMHWLMTAHVGRHHCVYESNGRIWQGRFKAFPVADDRHLLTLIRYVERNPVRPGLAQRAEDWPWSSLALSAADRRAALGDLAPAAVAADWLEVVNEPLTGPELEAVRTCCAKNRPFGSREWQQKMAEKLGLQSSLRGRGRPRKLKPPPPE